MEHLHRLKSLLREEMEEDIRLFREKIDALSLKEKKSAGYCWHPVQVIKTGFTYGDRAFVVVERKDNLTHELRSGNIVNLHSEIEPLKDSITGTINYIKEHTMKIVFNSDRLPLWLDSGALTVDLLFDERTYREMQKALDAAIKASGNRLAELREVLLGKTPPITHRISPVSLPHLNDSQNEALTRILGAEDVFLVHGPPGTGKTTTMVEAIRLTVKDEGQVLVCAPSNTAVDLLTERLIQKGLKVTRIGNISRVGDTVIQATLDAQLSAHPEFKEIKKLKIQAAEKRRQAERYKRRYDKQAALQRREYYREAGELNKWAFQLEERLIHQILSSADVITCTLTGAAGQVIAKYQFRTVFIDEAAQALEPAIWIAALKARRMIFAGDPFQLPPTVKSPVAARGGLHITVPERLISQDNAVSLLKVQYRMNEAIMGFSNERFYQGALRADDSISAHILSENFTPPVQFIDTAGTGFEEKTDEENKIRYNPDEARLISELLHRLKKYLPQGENPDISVITPYRAQVKVLQNEVYGDRELKDLRLRIDTIDSFQGQESDVVFISLVRSNDRGEIGFLKDYRRMNVAMTRARKLLVVVGDSATIGQDEFYEAFLNYVEKKGIYRTAWEFFQGN